jgi:hypothetical protein
LALGDRFSRGIPFPFLNANQMTFIPKSFTAIVLLTLFPCCLVFPAQAQSSSYKGPRTADGKPDLNGIWQAINTADWDISAHASQGGHIASEGAQGAEPGGIGVVEGGAIPYLPEALKIKADHYAKRFTDDPEIKCYMPGVPRAAYQPFPFQIVQSPKMIMMAYEFAAASRQVYMGKAPEADESWMGTSAGHWEGDTLVIDVTGQNDQTWFDRAGDFHSDALHVTERYIPVNEDVIRYEALITDPKVFSRPWKLSMPLYRHVEPHARLMEFRCAEYIEELMYGQYRKKPNP